jgi:hypothetical protein
LYHSPVIIIIMKFKCQHFDLGDDESQQGDSMDYDSGLGDSVPSLSSGGIGGGIATPILSTYLTCEPSYEYEKVAERKRKAAIPFFVAATSSVAATTKLDPILSTSTKVGGKKKLTAAYLINGSLPSSAAGSSSPTFVDISNDPDTKCNVKLPSKAKASKK